MGLKCGISAATSQLNGEKEIIHCNILTVAEYTVLHIPETVTIKDKINATLRSALLLQCPVFDTGQQQICGKKSMQGTQQLLKTCLLREAPLLFMPSAQGFVPLRTRAGFFPPFLLYILSNSPLYFPFQGLCALPGSTDN